MPDGMLDWKSRRQSRKGRKDSGTRNPTGGTGTGIGIGIAGRGAGGPGPVPAIAGDAQGPETVTGDDLARDPGIDEGGRGPGQGTDTGAGDRGAGIAMTIEDLERGIGMTMDPIEMEFKRFSITRYNFFHLILSVSQIFLLRIKPPVFPELRSQVLWPPRPKTLPPPRPWRQTSWSSNTMHLLLGSLKKRWPSFLLRELPSISKYVRKSSSPEHSEAVEILWLKAPSLFLKLAKEGGGERG